MISQDFLQAIANQHSVSDREMEVLRPAIMEGKATKAIAKELNISEVLVRKRLSDIYKKFHITGKGPVKFRILEKLLDSKYEASVAGGVTTAPPVIDNSPVLVTTDSLQPLQTQDWGEAPDISVFYGREAELATLSEWILQEQCRIVALLGMGGIGKTILAVKLGKQIQEQFEFLMWRSLYSQPSIADLLRDVIAFLSQQQESEFPEDINERISLLLQYMRKHRCLLILDDVESILRSSDRFGNDEQEYENYGVMFKRLGEVEHQSCLLLCSQEKPKEIGIIESLKRPVHSFFLKGLELEDSKEILREQGLTGEGKWEYLINCARGNPFALKIISAIIKDLFNDNVADFTRHATWVFGDFRLTLDQQWVHLSKLQKQIMLYLASLEKAASFSNIKKEISGLSNSELIEALAFLKRRSLIVTTLESSETVYDLEYLLRKYISKYHFTK